MYVTLVHVKVKQDSLEAFIEATRLNHQASILEPGNLRFDILQDPEFPTHFMLYEAYENQEGAKMHKDEPHYQIWRQTVEPMMLEPRRGVPMRGLFP